MILPLARWFWFALWLIILSHIAIPLLGLAHGGFWLWPIDVGRPALLLLFAWLAWRGRAWAQWVLIVLLALSLLYFLSVLTTAALQSSLLITVIAATTALVTLWVAAMLILERTNASQPTHPDAPAA